MGSCWSFAFTENEVPVGMLYVCIRAARISATELGIKMRLQR